MSEGQSPSPQGPSVGESEELYRCITHPSWWIEEEGRISSAAFKYPVFSVDVASISGSPENTLKRFHPGTGLARFLCRDAKALGCDVRQEIDEQHPQNQAHAHVYTPDGSARKKTAKRLAELCSRQILVKPSFDSLG